MGNDVSYAITLFQIACIPSYLEDSFDILFVSVIQFWDCPAPNKAFKFTDIPYLEGKKDFLDLTASKQIF